MNDDQAQLPLRAVRRDFGALTSSSEALRERLISELQAELERYLHPRTASRFASAVRAVEFEPVAFFTEPSTEERERVAASARRQISKILDDAEQAIQDRKATLEGPGRFDAETILRIAEIVCGGRGSPDERYPKYRSSPELTRFFKNAGFPEIRHDGSTRTTWAEAVLDEMSRADLDKVISRLGSRKEYDSAEQWQHARKVLDEALVPESLRLSESQNSPSVEPLEEGRLDVTTPTPAATNRRIFVVHGRNLEARNAMFTFLRSLGLDPIEWDRAVMETGSGTPWTGDVIERAIRSAAAVVVLMTPEDEGRLIERFHGSDEEFHEINLTPQARQNVIFELGMAFGVVPDRTLTIGFGRTRPFSDVVGRNLIMFDPDGAAFRNKISMRLQSMGIPIIPGTDWLTAGDFSKV